MVYKRSSKHYSDLRITLLMPVQGAGDEQWSMHAPKVYPVVFDYKQNITYKMYIMSETSDSDYKLNKICTEIINTAKRRVLFLVNLHIFRLFLLDIKALHIGFTFQTWKLCPYMSMVLSVVQWVQGSGQGCIQVRAGDPKAVYWAAHSVSAQLEELQNKEQHIHHIWSTCANQLFESCFVNSVSLIHSGDILYVPAGIQSSVCPKGVPHHSMKSHWLSCNFRLSECSTGCCHEAPPTPSHTFC